MQIKQKTMSVHQFTSTEWAALCDVENLIREVHDSYDSNVILENPNTGECIAIEELPRVLGILSFLTDNRVVEVNPK